MSIIPLLSFTTRVNLATLKAVSARTWLDRYAKADTLPLSADGDVAIRFRHQMYVLDLFLRQAHEHSSYHWGELYQSAVCGCFRCCETFSFNEIEEWVDKGVTALCPECGIDAVIGDASGYAVDDAEFLDAMRRRWFG